MNEAWIAIAILSAALVVLAFYTLRLNRRLQAAREEQQEHFEKIRRELAAINSAAIGVGQRLISTEKKLKSAIEQQELQDSVHAVEEPFKQAASSAEQGMGVEELMTRYGLSEAEAKLMALINMRRVS